MESTKLNNIFFLVYDSRSGSTFLANLLVKYVGAAIPPETNFVYKILSNYNKNTIDNDRDLNNILEIIYKDRKFSDWNLERKELESCIKPNLPLTIGNLILEICSLYKNKNFPNSKIFGLKKSYYLTQYEQMKKMFPQAKFVGIVRDGRAVFNSKKHSIYSVTGKPFETNPYKAAKRWCKICRKLREVQNKYPQETISIRYEEMIQDTEQTVDRVSQFLNVTELQELENKTYAIPDRYGELHKNVNKKPLTNRINAWQKSLSAQEIYAFESIAHKELTLAGYSTINNQFSFNNKLWMGWLKFLKSS